MMKKLLSMLLVMVAAVALAEEPAPAAAAAADVPGIAWIGLDVVKPDEATRAQLPDLPLGIGFVVRGMHEKGPAAAAGMQAFDVIWKMDGQLLVNEAQLATLLRLKTPGDRVVFDTFRSGKPLSQAVTLMAVPVGQQVVAAASLASLMPSGETVPMRVVHVETRTATLQLSEGKAALRRLPQGDELEILATDGSVVFRGMLPLGDELPSVPAAWRQRVLSLRSGLNQALNSELAPLRVPRQRILPSPAVPEPNEKTN